MATLAPYLKDGTSKLDLIAQAAALYSVHGSYQTVSEHLSIPESTIRGWAITPEYQTSLAECRGQRAEKLKSKLALIIEDAYENMHLRVKDGDVKIVKGQDGEHSLMHVPMTGKDLAVAAGITIDKLLILQGNSPAQIQADKLDALADKLERIASHQAKDVTP